MSDPNIRLLGDLQARLAELTKARDLQNTAPATSARAPNNDVVSQLETLVGLVETSQKVIDTLVATIREHEDASRDMKRMLCEETAQKEVAHQHAARLESAIRAEKERADVAEERAKSAEEEVRILKSREVVVGKHVDWLITGVGNLAAAGQIKTPLMASIALRADRAA